MGWKFKKKVKEYTLFVDTVLMIECCSLFLCLSLYSQMSRKNSLELLNIRTCSPVLFILCTVDQQF